MRNALNALADTVKDADQKEVCIPITYWTAERVVLTR